MQHSFGKTLVVGASGFVGRALVRELGQRGVQVVAHTRNTQVVFPDVEMRHGDLNEYAVCTSLLQGVQTVIYLAAAKKNLKEHTERPFDFVAENVRPFLTFTQALKESSVSECIYLSSTHAEKEWEPGTDGYAIGKYINELVVAPFCAQTGKSIAVIRSGAVYGPGDTFDPKTANFIPSLIQRIDTSEGEFVVWGSGERKMQFIYVDDLVENIIAAVGSGVPLATIGNPEVWSVNEIVGECMRLFKKEGMIQHDLSKPDKATQLFEFTNFVPPRIGMKEGLENTIGYYKTNVAHIFSS